MKEEKRYLVCLHRNDRTFKKIYITGTVSELTEYFDYTLKCGKGWENGRGCKKITLRPRTINSLVTNVNNAKNNTSCNGYSSEWLELIKEVPADYVLEAEYK